jgi:hypothetical protein
MLPNNSLPFSSGLQIPEHPTPEWFVADFLENLESVGLTRGQVGLANRLGTTQSLVSKCERGERRLDPIELRRWVMELGLSFPEFIAEFEARLRGRKGKASSSSKRKREAE